MRRTMDSDVDLERRRITALAALALLGCTITLTGCAGGSGSPAAPSATPAPTPPAASTCPANGACGSVSANHSLRHIAVITAAQLGAGSALSLDIQGDAFHSHTLTLTGTQVIQIAGGARVSQDSSRDTHSDGSGPHSHTVTFN